MSVEYEADEGLLGTAWKGTVVYRLLVSNIINQYHLVNQLRGILAKLIGSVLDLFMLYRWRTRAMTDYLTYDFVVLPRTDRQCRQVLFSPMPLTCGLHWW